MSLGDANYLTKEGLELLQKELHGLKTVKRREVASKIERAKELGDLSENAEYQEAKEELAFTEGRIIEIESILAHAEVIEEKANLRAGIVSVGSTVIAKADSREINYQIVGSNEAEPKAGKISNESPLGQAFLGKAIGDNVDVTTPSGTITYRITAIE